MKTQTPINMTCICCPLGCDLAIAKSGAEFIITGNKCPRGKKYAIEELTAPKRIVTSTVKITGGVYPVIPVKTAQAIPKEKIFTIMRILANVEVTAPVYVGDIVVKNIADTGINVVATCSCGRGVRAAEGA
jgi:CxxC motif-containing protein